MFRLIVLVNVVLMYGTAFMIAGEPHITRGKDNRGTNGGRELDQRWDAATGRRAVDPEGGKRRPGEYYLFVLCDAL